MDRTKRAHRIVKAVFDHQSTSESNSNDENNDPFADSDDRNDPTYSPRPLPRRPQSHISSSSGSHQTCEYVSCSSDVFSACNKCNSSLCWDHFENVESYNDCEFHNNSALRTNVVYDNTLTEDID
jgi:hypothetical protein